MNLPPFDYHEPDSLGDALDLLSRYGDEASVLAGGTALVLMLKQKLLRPSHVIGLSRLRDLRRIERSPDGSLRIGALATHREIERSATVQAYCSALSDTFRGVATVRIRHQATIGGNLVHADPAQDPPVMLLAMDARVELAGGAGVRLMPLSGFFEDHYQTAIRPDEILTYVHLPAFDERMRWSYLKFLPRSAEDYAAVSVAVGLSIYGGRCRDVRVALGSVAPTAVRARALETSLVGETLEPARIAESARLVDGSIDPLDDARGSAAYKRAMAIALTRRVLTTLAAS